MHCPQENNTDEELLPLLEHVRPGGGFRPDCTLFASLQVNGAAEHPLFTFLKQKLPLPSDLTVSEAVALYKSAPFHTSRSLDRFPTVIVQPSDVLAEQPATLLWSPLRRSDIAWNFEKFLVNGSGEPVQRFSSAVPPLDLQQTIAALLAQ